MDVKQTWLFVVAAVIVIVIVISNGNLYFTDKRTYQVLHKYKKKKESYGKRRVCHKSATGMFTSASCKELVITVGLTVEEYRCGITDHVAGGNCTFQLELLV